MSQHTPDLTKQSPRSARVRLGGFVILPRMLDKGRAELAGKNGEYHFNCPLDQHFLKFAGIEAAPLLEEMKAGKGDGEILDWIHEHSTTRLAAHDIIAWSSYHEGRGPSELGQREYFHDIHTQVAPHRKDVSTWFEILDVDDYVSYGGKA